jgi:hypothetical protein
MKERLPTGRIEIFGTNDDVARIYRVIEEAFTEEERNIMCRYTGVSVFVANMGFANAGKYVCKNKGMPGPSIFLRPGAREDNIVHEFVHHLRVMDNSRIGIVRTPYAVNENGEEIESAIHKKYNFDINNVEESVTVAETTARRRSIGGVSGYYSCIQGTGSYDAYIHDRLLLTDSEHESTSYDRIGEEAVDAVIRLYDRTKISDACIVPKDVNGRTAKESRGLLEKEGIIKNKKERIKNE